MSKKFIRKALQIAKIVSEKNQQYGDAINDTQAFLELLFPRGIKCEQYKDIGTLVRIYDKLKRIANGNQGNENAWDDIQGYALLANTNIKGDEENEL